MSFTVIPAAVSTFAVVRDRTGRTSQFPVIAWAVEVVEDSDVFPLDVSVHPIGPAGVLTNVSRFVFPVSTNDE